MDIQISEEFIDSLSSESIASQHGHHFQQKIATLAIVRGSDSGHHKFRIATELRAMNTFDDIVYLYKITPDSPWRARLICVKHNEGSSRTNKQLAMKDFLSSSSDYCLRKFLTGFQEIQEHFEMFSFYSSFCNTEIDDLVYIANAKLSAKAVNEFFEEDPGALQSDVLFKIQPGSIQHSAVKYKLNEQKFKGNHQLEKDSNFELLTMEIVNNLGNKKSLFGGKLFTEYFYPLTRNVFEITFGVQMITLKFRKNFILGTDLDELTTNFRAELEIKFSGLRQELQSFKDIEWNLNNCKEIFVKPNPTITDIKNFTKHLTEIIQDSGNLNPAGTCSTKHPEGFTNNIKSTIGYVFVRSCNAVRFRSSFLTGEAILPKDISLLRDELQRLVNFKELYKYELKLPSFKTMSEFNFDRNLPKPLTSDCIDEFISKFRFVSDYPNRHQLNSIINPELENLFTTLGIRPHRAITESDTMSRMSGRSGTFFKGDQTNAFKTKIANLFKHHSTEGSNDVFFSNSKSRIEFAMVDPFIGEFLQGEDEILNVVCERLDLARIATIQSFKRVKTEDSELKRLEKYWNGNGYVFYELKSLMSTEFLNVVRLLFQSQCLCNVIFILFDQVVPAGMLDPFYDTLQSNSNKKLVLISESSVAIPEERSDLTIVNRSISDQDLQRMSLSNESRTKLNLQILNIQGNRTALGDIINGTDQINFELLNQIALTDDTLCVGTPNQSSQGYDKEYYIDRQLIREVEIKFELFSGLDNEDLSNIFVIGSNDIDSLKNKVPNIERYSQVRLIEQLFSKERFQEICELYPDRSLHWLCYEDGRLIWEDSSGSIAPLIKYRVEHEKPMKKKVLTESKLIDILQVNKFVAVADTAGSGKTTIIDSLIKVVRTREQISWTVKINLNKYATFLSDAENSVNPPKIIDFMNSKNKTKLKNKIEEWIFQKFVESGRVYLFFDGYDEVSPRYSEVVLGFLESISGMERINVCITTRITVRSDLELRMNHFAYSILPFDKERQKDFLVKYWTHLQQLQPLNNPPKDLRNYSEIVLDVFSNSINDEVNKFTGIALLTVMVAEIFREPESLEAITMNFNLLDLYRKFVNKIYLEIFGRKVGADINNIAYNLIQTSKRPFQRFHQQMAFLSIFDTSEYKLKAVDEVREWQEQMTDFQIDEEQRGLIDGDNEGRPNFIHRTFAEYFIAEYLLQNLKRLENSLDRALFFNKILCLKEFNIIRLFLENGLDEIFLKINFVQYEASIVDSFIRRCRMEYFDIHNILYVACDEELFNVANMVVQALKNRQNILKSILNTECSDTLLIKLGNTNWTGPETFCHVLAKNNNQKILKLLHENGADPNILIQQDFIAQAPIHQAIEYHSDDVIEYLIKCDVLRELEMLYRTNDDVLDFAAKMKNPKIVEQVLMYYKDTGLSYGKDLTVPLAYAAESSTISVVDLLLDYGAAINRTVSFHGSPKSKVVHIAAARSNVEMVKRLIDRGADIYATDDIGNTVLHSAARNTSTAVLNYLSSKVFPPNDQIFNHLNGNLENCLHIACAYLETIDSIIDKIDDSKSFDCCGRGPIHIAGSAGNIKIIKTLIDYGANINELNVNQRSALHCAAEYQKWDTIKFLIDNGATTINQQDTDGNTVLHLAAKGCSKIGSHVHTPMCQHIVRYLLDKGTDPDILNKNQQTVLLMAICSHNFNVIKLFVELNPELISQKISGDETLFDVVISKITDFERDENQFKSLNFLLEKGARIENFIALFEAVVDFNSFPQFKRVIEIGLQLDVPQLKDSTLLLHVAELGSLKMMEHMMDLLPWDSNTLLKSVLRLASQKLKCFAENQPKKVKYLLNKVNFDDIDLEGHFSAYVIRHSPNPKIYETIFDTIKFIRQEFLDDQLHRVVKVINKDEIQYLVRKGANVNSIRLGKNLFQLLFSVKKPFHNIMDIIRVLIKNGIVVDEESHPKVVEEIAKHGATDDISQLRIDKTNFLKIASSSSNYEIIRSFPVQSDHERKSQILTAIAEKNLNVIFHLAYKKINFNMDEPAIVPYLTNCLGAQNILRWIVYNGGDIQRKDEFGKTAIFDKTNAENFRFLIKHGANLEEQDDKGEIFLEKLERSTDRLEK